MCLTTRRVTSFPQSHLSFATQCCALFSGQPSGELPFDPAVVRDHFLKLRAALAWYYQGQHILDGITEPQPSNPKYIAVIQQISKVFAAAFVSGADFNVGCDDFGHRFPSFHRGSLPPTRPSPYRFLRSSFLARHCALNDTLPAVL